MSSRFTAFFKVEVDFDMLEDVDESELSEPLVIEEIRRLISAAANSLIDMGAYTNQPVALGAIRVESDPELERH